MRFLKWAIAGMIILFLFGCSNTQESEDVSLEEFSSGEYGFSFSFPAGWQEVTANLPRSWAMVKGENTILFTVNPSQEENLMVLGKVQALRDLYTDAGTELDQEKVDEINNMVKLSSFNDRGWYTYAIEFAEKGINSIVSGTICGNNEVNLVLVSDFSSYEENKEIYTTILESFDC